MRLVLDTNIVVSGLIWGGTPRRLLDQGREGRVTFYTSSLLLDELAEVLYRDKFEAMLASKGVTPAFLMQRYGMLAKLVSPPTIERAVRDPDDDVVIATAVAAHADVIVSGDNDLLALGEYHGIRIMNPTAAITLIGLI